MIRFGVFDEESQCWPDGEVYIREVSLMSGGFGCSLWDGAVILARWIVQHADIFKDKVVHELGCGVALPAIVAARYAKIVYLSDYLPGVVENAQYNISLNSNEDYDNDEDSTELMDITRQEKRASHRLIKQHWKERIKNRTVCKLMNWDQVEHEGNERDNQSIHVDDELDWKQDNSSTTHEEDIAQADFIIGSELTYSDKSVQGLIRTILRYLKPSGIFYEVLSADRDGVSTFVQGMKEQGFEVVVNPAPSHLFQPPFKTTQRPETYHLYTFRQPDHQQFPNFH